MTPKTICSSAAGVLRDEWYNIITMDTAMQLIRCKDEVFIKPTVDSGSGKGCRLFRLTDSQTLKSVQDYMISMGDDYVVQEKVICHKYIRDIYSGSVNTFRIITYRWMKNGNPFITHMPVIMRIGRSGNFLDNAHAGGMFIAVSEEGHLHKTAFTEFGDIFVRHPDSHVVFEGYKIEGFKEMVKADERLAAALPQVGVVNWDFTINQEGQPVLIEANCLDGSIWLIEVAHGIGAFKENTVDVLKWLNVMKKLPDSKRHCYRYGRGMM